MRAVVIESMGGRSLAVADVEVAGVNGKIAEVGRGLFKP
jgi:hypothetical protein